MTFPSVDEMFPTDRAKAIQVVYERCMLGAHQLDGTDNEEAMTLVATSMLMLGVTIEEQLLANEALLLRLKESRGR